jgi:hypothetical protein
MEYADTALSTGRSRPLEVDLLAEKTEDTIRRSLQFSRSEGPLNSILTAAGEAEAGSGGERPAEEWPAESQPRP